VILSCTGSINKSQRLLMKNFGLDLRNRRFLARLPARPPPPPPHTHIGQLFQKLKRGAQRRRERLKSKMSFSLKGKKCASHTESWWKFYVLTGKTAVDADLHRVYRSYHSNINLRLQYVNYNADFNFRNRTVVCAWSLLSVTARARTVNNSVSLLVILPC